MGKNCLPFFDGYQSIDGDSKFLKGIVSHGEVALENRHVARMEKVLKR